jgi:ribosomal protein L11 methyltransferase
MTAFPPSHRSARTWQKISIRVDPRMTEAVAAYLNELTGTGVEISVAANGQPETAALSPTETITAYIPVTGEEPGRGAAAEQTEDMRLFLARVHRIFPGCPPPVLQAETIMEEDWGQKWKSFFTSLQITPHLIIKPSWEAAGTEQGKGQGAVAVIEMDPGLAFGTGHHASTQLALLLLEDLFQDNANRPERILDVGTGSGILAMACALFGAREVWAIDNDPDAVETARQNVLRNRLEDKISVSGQEISSLRTGFDLIVANITRDVLAELASLVAGIIKPRGFLVLSGILKGEQEHFIGKTYAEHGFVCRKGLVQDEWAALQLQKK